MSNNSNTTFYVYQLPQNFTKDDLIQFFSNYSGFVHLSYFKEFLTLTFHTTRQASTALMKIQQTTSMIASWEPMDDPSTTLTPMTMTTTATTTENTTSTSFDSSFPMEKAKTTTVTTNSSYQITYGSNNNSGSFNNTNSNTTNSKGSNKMTTTPNFSNSSTIENCKNTTTTTTTYTNNYTNNCKNVTLHDNNSCKDILYNNNNNNNNMILNSINNKNASVNAKAQNTKFNNNKINNDLTSSHSNISSSNSSNSKNDVNPHDPMTNKSKGNDSNSFTPFKNLSDSKEGYGNSTTTTATATTEAEENTTNGNSNAHGKKTKKGGRVTKERSISNNFNGKKGMKKEQPMEQQDSLLTSDTTQGYVENGKSNSSTKTMTDDKTQKSENEITVKNYFSSSNNNSGNNSTPKNINTNKNVNKENIVSPEGVNKSKKSERSSFSENYRKNLKRDEGVSNTLDNANNKGTVKNDGMNGITSKFLNDANKSNTATLENLNGVTATTATTTPTTQNNINSNTYYNKNASVNLNTTNLTNNNKKVYEKRYNSTSFSNPNGVHSSSIPVTSSSSLILKPKKTLHITNFTMNKSALRSILLTYSGFKTVAFYQDYCFVVFANVESATAAAEDLLSKTKLKVNFSKADYIPNVVSPSSIGNPNSILHITNYPASTTEIEMIEIYSSYPGYLNIHFSRNFSLVYYQDIPSAKNALQHMNQTTNFTTIYSIKNANNVNMNYHVMPPFNPLVNGGYKNMNTNYTHTPEKLNGYILHHSNGGSNNNNGANPMNLPTMNSGMNGYIKYNTTPLNGNNLYLNGFNSRSNGHTTTSNSSGNNSMNNTIISNNNGTGSNTSAGATTTSSLNNINSSNGSSNNLKYTGNGSSSTHSTNLLSPIQNGSISSYKFNPMNNGFMDGPGPVNSTNTNNTNTNANANANANANTNTNNNNNTNTNTNNNNNTNTNTNTNNNNNTNKYKYYNVDNEKSAIYSSPSTQGFKLPSITNANSKKEDYDVTNSTYLKNDQALLKTGESNELNAGEDYFDKSSSLKDYTIPSSKSDSNLNGLITRPYPMNNEYACAMANSKFNKNYGFMMIPADGSSSNAPQQQQQQQQQQQTLPSYSHDLLDDKKFSKFSFLKNNNASSDDINNESFKKANRKFSAPTPFLAKQVEENLNKNSEVLKSNTSFSSIFSLKFNENELEKERNEDLSTIENSGIGEVQYFNNRNQVNKGVNSSFSSTTTTAATTTTTAAAAVATTSKTNVTSITSSATQNKIQDTKYYIPPLPESVLTRNYSTLLNNTNYSNILPNQNLLYSALPMNSTGFIGHESGSFLNEALIKPSLPNSGHSIFNNNLSRTMSDSAISSQNPNQNSDVANGNNKTFDFGHGLKNEIIPQKFYYSENDWKFNSNSSIGNEVNSTKLPLNNRSFDNLSFLRPIGTVSQQQQQQSLSHPLKQDSSFYSDLLNSTSSFKKSALVSTASSSRNPSNSISLNNNTITKVGLPFSQSSLPFAYPSSSTTEPGYQLNPNSSSFVDTFNKKNENHMNNDFYSSMNNNSNISFSSDYISQLQYPLESYSSKNSVGNKENISSTKSSNKENEKNNLLSSTFIGMNKLNNKNSTYYEPECANEEYKNSNKNTNISDNNNNNSKGSDIKDYSNYINDLNSSSRSSNYSDCSLNDDDFIEFIATKRITEFNDDKNDKTTVTANGKDGNTNSTINPIGSNSTSNAIEATDDSSFSSNNNKAKLKNNNNKDSTITSSTTSTTTLNNDNKSYSNIFNDSMTTTTTTTKTTNYGLTTANTTTATSMNSLLDSTKNELKSEVVVNNNNNKELTDPSGSDVYNPFSNKSSLSSASPTLIYSPIAKEKNELYFDDMSYNKTSLDSSIINPYISSPIMVNATSSNSTLSAITAANSLSLSSSALNVTNSTTNKSILKGLYNESFSSINSLESNNNPINNNINTTTTTTTTTTATTTASIASSNNSNNGRPGFLQNSSFSQFLKNNNLSGINNDVLGNAQAIDYDKNNGLAVSDQTILNKLNYLQKENRELSKMRDYHICLISELKNELERMRIENLNLKEKLNKNFL